MSNPSQAGFGSGGVGKGTPASYMHSDFGNVNAGSKFSGYQSSGAKSGQPAGNSATAAGFNQGNVSRGSVASHVQSDRGNVSKGSNFSKMQSGKK